MSGVRRALVGVFGASMLLACPADDVSEPALSEGETGASDTGEPGAEGARDLKSLDASSCVTHPDSLLATFTLSPRGDYVNNSSLDGRVLCPLVRDRPDSEESSRVDVSVRDASESDEITCVAIARDLQGDIVAQSALKSTAGLGAQVLSLEFGSSDPFAYHYVDCSIPREDPASGGGQSGITSFIISEVRTAEVVNQKSYSGLSALPGLGAVLGGAEPVIDELGFAELYFPQSDGLNPFVLPIVRDNPELNPLSVRVHYVLEEGGFISCVFITSNTNGVDADVLNSDTSIEVGLGTLEIAVPVLPQTNGPCALSCVANGPVGILAYDVDES